jgi:hypothetical protein
MSDDDMTWWHQQDQELEQLEEQERIKDCDIALAIWRYERDN